MKNMKHTTTGIISNLVNTNLFKLDKRGVTSGKIDNLPYEECECTGSNTITGKLDNLPSSLHLSMLYFKL